MSEQVSMMLENVSTLTFDDKPLNTEQLLNPHEFYADKFQKCINRLILVITQLQYTGKIVRIRIRTNADGLSQLPYRIRELATAVLRLGIVDTTPRRRNGMLDKRFKPSHVNRLHVWERYKKGQYEKISDALAQFLFGNLGHRHGKIVREYDTLIELAPR